MTSQNEIVLGYDLPSHFQLEIGFTYLAPERLFDYFVEPELLQKWWPPQATTDPRPGGAYHLAWPSMDWHLQGTYLELNHGSELVFTWKWDHTPDLPQRVVAMTFTPLDEGSLLQIAQGEYGDDKAEQDDRQSHVDGWRHFLGQLQSITATT